MKTDFKVGRVCIVLSDDSILDAMIVAKFSENLFGVFDTDRVFHQIKREHMFKTREEAAEVMKFEYTHK